GSGGDPQGLRPADDAAVPGGGQTGAGFHLVEGEGEQDGGGGAAGVGQGAGAEEALSGVEQRVVSALSGAAPIRLPTVTVGGWAGEGVKDGLPHRGRLPG